METYYIALSIYTLFIVFITYAMTKKVVYKRGFRDGRDFEYLSYRVSWETAIDNIREDLNTQRL